MFHSISGKHRVFFSLLVLLAFLILGFAAARQFERDKQLSPIDGELQSRITRTTGVMVRMVRQAQDVLPDQSSNGLFLPEHEQNFGPDSYFYIIWRTGDGEPVLWYHSESAPIEMTPPVDAPVSTENRTVRTRKSFREIVHHSRHGFLLVVGRDISDELSSIRGKSTGLALLGVLLLAGVMAYSFWVAKQALKPVVAISTAATRIADGALDERIKISSVRSELGELGDVLNHTFDKLENAYRRQTQFTADASHELRTPVAVILTEIQSAPKLARTPEEYEECLNVCEEAATSMQILLQQLMALAQFDAGKVEKCLDPFDLCEVAEACLERIRPMAAAQNLSLSSDFPENVICKGDSDRISQIVTNLLSNAVAYNRKGGEVKVSIENKENEAVLRVSDTGVGIAEEDLGHIFERFYRADKSRYGEGEHSGLGLAICKEIVDLHDGRISVESSPGEGSTFILRLPV